LIPSTRACRFALKIRRSLPRGAALLSLAALFVFLVPAKNAAQEQAPTTGEIKGIITDENKPLAGARLNFANVHAGKTFKIKPDNYGRFLLQDAPYGYYDVEVMSADGDHAADVRGMLNCLAALGRATARDTKKN
jgi:hypothetical protein